MLAPRWRARPGCTSLRRIMSDANEDVGVPLDIRVGETPKMQIVLGDEARLVVTDFVRDGRLFWRIERGTVTDGRWSGEANNSLTLRWDELEQARDGLMATMEEEGHAPPIPDFLALAARYREVEVDENPTREAIALARILTAIGVAEDEDDVEFLETLAGVAQTFLKDRLDWGAGSSFLVGRGRKPVAAERLLAACESLCLLDDAEIDARIELNRAPLPRKANDGSSPTRVTTLWPKPEDVDRAHVVALSVAHAVKTLFPQYTPHGEGDAAATVIDAIAVRLRALLVAKQNRATSSALSAVRFDADDAEDVAKAALRAHGVPEGTVTNFFKFRDMRVRRQLAEDADGRIDGRSSPKPRGEPR